MSSTLENLGIITLLMMKNPRYQGLTLRQLQTFALTPLQHNLAITASATPDKKGAASTPVAFAIFARVNDAWDAKLRDPAFAPTELPASAWTSGNIQWLIELVSVRKVAPVFIDQTARAVFPKGGTLSIRTVDAKGAIKIETRQIALTD